MSSRPEEPPSRLTFAELQRWFLGRVVSRSSSGTPAANSLIRPSATLTPDQRIAIYRGAYLQRLRGIVANEHPTIERLLGKQAFDDLVRDYLDRFPPHDYTLRVLAHALPYYLQRYCKHEHAALFYDVARLERAVSDAFDTPSFGKVTNADLARVPADAWAEVRFRVDPSFRVLAFDYDAPAFVDAYHTKRDMPEIAPRKAWAVVWRHENRVWRQPVSLPVHVMLASFVAGESVTTAVERCMEVWQGEEAELESKIFRWFASWIEEGYFRAIVLPAVLPAAESTGEHE